MRILFKNKRLLNTTALFLIFAVLLFPSFLLNTKLSWANNSSSILYGDLNGDGKVDSTDYVFMRRYILNIIADFPHVNGKIAADVNGDGVINSTDSILMRRFLLSIIDIFPVQNISPTPTVTPTPTSTTIPTPSATPSVNLNGLYKITSRHSNKVIEVHRASTEQHANVVQWEYNGTSNQHWTITDNGGGNFRIINEYSNQALEVYYAEMDNGSNVVQFPFSGHSCQLWRIIPSGDNYYSIINVNSGKYLDVSSRSTENGASIIQWEHTGRTNQQFSIERVQPGKEPNPNPGNGGGDPGAEVTRSGSTWSTRLLDGNVVYTGTSMVEAINAACSRMTGGTINIRSSGDINDRIRPRANQSLDFHGNTINSSVGAIPLYAENVNGITIRNMNMKGAPRYGIWFRGCSNVSFHNIVLTLNEAPEVGLGIRVDNHRDRPVRTTNLKVTGEMRIEGTRGHGFETYGIDGIKIDKIVTKNTGGCGLLLNESKNAEIGTIDAYRANHGGGYAGFRVANNNGPNVNVETLIAKECGRGFFSVSGSHGTTINNVDITGCTGHGMLIQNAQDTVIKGGRVWNNNCAEAVRIASDPNSGGSATRNVTIQNLRVYDDRGSNRRQTYGIRETASGGTDRNSILNNDLRTGGSNRSNDLVIEGPNTVSRGNRLTGD